MWSMMRIGLASQIDHADRIGIAVDCRHCRYWRQGDLAVGRDLHGVGVLLPRQVVFLVVVTLLSPIVSTVILSTADLTPRRVAVV